MSVALMAESARFALQRGISRYVTVTTTPIERLMKRQGLHIHRIGPPMRIGVVMTVACVIEVDEITLNAVGVPSPPPLELSVDEQHQREIQHTLPFEFTSTQHR
jgi:N-acyl-L-homoserine lactone synthetase